MGIEEMVCGEASDGNIIDEDGRNGMDIGGIADVDDRDVRAEEEVLRPAVA